MSGPKKEPELVIERKDGTKVTVKPMKAWSPKPSFKIDFLMDAKAHQAADKLLGRVWACGCVACLKIKDAAPELLEAAKYFRSLVDADLLDSLTRDGNKHNDAIAKAEGR